MSVDFDSEFKAIVCNSGAIISAISSMLFGMNMYNRGLKYNYRFHSLSTNASKTYSEVGLYTINNLAVVGAVNGKEGFDEPIDKEYICLIMHGRIYTQVLIAIQMARQSLATGKSYIFTFNIPGKGQKSYNECGIIQLSNEAEQLNKCCDLNGSCITECYNYFNNNGS